MAFVNSLFKANNPLPRARRQLNRCIGISNVLYSKLPKITVSHNQVLIDEQVDVEIQNLKPRQKVILKCDVNAEGKQFTSTAHFASDAFGLVRTSKHASTGGSYTGIQPMGLFTHMDRSAEQRVGMRLMVRDVSKPLCFNISVFPDSSADPYCHTTLERYYKHPAVKRIGVKSGNIRGALFVPAGPGRHPGVIDLFGTVGGLVEYRAALLASRGFTALALPYFAYDDLPATFGIFDLAYFEEAVQWMLQNEHVKGKHVGVIGTSKGGEIAVQMATHFPQVACAAAINGSYTYWSMSYKGLEFDDLPWPQTPLEERDGVWQVRGGADHQNILDPAREGVIPVERCEGHIMYIVGGDDGMQLSAAIARQSYQRLIDANKRDHFTLLTYPGAGHTIDPPYSPLCDTIYHPVFKMLIRMGGNKDQHARAQEHAWRAVLRYFTERLT